MTLQQFLTTLFLLQVWVSRGICTPELAGTTTDVIEIEMIKNKATRAMNQQPPDHN